MSIYFEEIKNHECGIVCIECNKLVKHIYYLESLGEDGVHITNWLCRDCFIKLTKMD